MENRALQVFNFEEQPIRTIEQDGELFWVAGDVCKALGLTHITNSLSRVDEDDCRQTTVIDSLGREQITYVVNESGLYSLILGSDKPEAKRFKKWVTSEVLPSIRKTGKYSIGSSKKDIGYQHKAEEMQGIISALTMIGLSKTQAIIAANREINKQYSVDFINIAGDALSLKCEVQESEITATTVGSQIGLSAVKVNKIALKMNFIVAMRDSKNRIYYNITEKGKSYCFLKDVQIDDKKSSKQQLMYYQSVVSLINGNKHLIENK